MLFSNIVLVALFATVALGDAVDCSLILDRLTCNKTPECIFCETKGSCIDFDSDKNAFLSNCPKCTADNEFCKEDENGVFMLKSQTTACYGSTSCDTTCYFCAKNYHNGLEFDNCVPRDSYAECSPCYIYDDNKVKCEFSGSCKWDQPSRQCEHTSSTKKVECNNIIMLYCKEFIGCYPSFGEGKCVERPAEDQLNTLIKPCSDFTNLNDENCSLVGNDGTKDIKYPYLLFEEGLDIFCGETADCPNSYCQKNAEDKCVGNPSAHVTVTSTSCSTMNFSDCYLASACSWNYVDAKCVESSACAGDACTSINKTNADDSTSCTVCTSPDGTYTYLTDCDPISSGADSKSLYYSDFQEDLCNLHSELIWFETQRECKKDTSDVNLCTAFNSKTTPYICSVYDCKYCPSQCGSINVEGCPAEDKQNPLVIIIVVVVIACFFLFVVILCIFLARQYFTVKKETFAGMSISTTQRPTFSREGATELPINCPELGLDINPAVLYFGARKAPIEVDKQEVENIIVKNTSSKKIKARFYIPSDDDRIQMKTSDESLVIKPGEEDQITLYITLLCTTKIDVTFPVVLEGTTPPFYTLMRICVESGLSTKLDYNEIDMKDLIGEGAFGSVYKGTWRGTAVAVKDFRAIIDVEASREVMHEISLLERLRSPYIVTFYGTVMNSRHNCIVMELAPLGSLASALTQHRINYNLKVRIALDCAKGMMFLHCNHVLHRDLKTDNLLVMSLDLESPQRIKITDFGTSRMITDEAARSYTHTVGTPIYTSPEILNNQPYSEKADVYSYGILLWSVYMQLVPYHDEFKNNFAIIKHVLGGNRPTVPPDMPTGYQTVMMKSWSHEPEDRPQFSELVNMLEEIDKQVNSDFY